MRQRIEQLLHVNPQGMWVGTFHGLAHRLLRAHWREAKLAENFQILDSDDQQRLVKRVIRELGLDEQRWPARQAQWWINAQKDEGLRPRNIQPGGDLFLATQLKIYEAYEEACARAGVIDFSELLLRALDLWRDHPGLLEHYQRRFRHVLVDEFQDTNAVQYAWLRLLAKGGESLMVVGDDDQSIYGWRRAHREPAPVQRRFPGRRNHPPGAELSLHRLHPQGRQRADRQQPGSPRQGTLDLRLRGRADQPVRRVQRARRSALRGRKHREGHPRRHEPQRDRHPLPLQRPVAGTGRGAAAREDPLPHLRRPALLRGVPRSRTPWPTCA